MKGGYLRRTAPPSAGLVRRAIALALAVTLTASPTVLAQATGQPAALPMAPTDVALGSITYDDIPYPFTVSYMAVTMYGQDVRLADMDVPPAGRRTAAPG